MKTWRKSPKNGRTKFLVPVEDADLSNVDIIGSPLVTRVEHVRQSNAKKKKKKEEVQSIETDEEDNTSEEDGTDSPEKEEEKTKALDKEEGMKEEYKEKVKLHHLQDPLTMTKTPKKRKVSPQNPSARKKTHANKPQSKNVLTEDDVGLIITVVEDASEDIL
jgi:hypothetical protein